jgi:hypothetical protein
MNEHSIISRNGDIPSQKIDDETVFFSLENSEYYGIDTIGSEIWKLIEKPITLNKLIDELLKDYDVTREQCTQDVLGFLQKLENKSLVKIV